MNEYLILHWNVINEFDETTETEKDGEGDKVKCVRGCLGVLGHLNDHCNSRHSHDYYIKARIQFKESHRLESHIHTHTPATLGPSLVHIPHVANKRARAHCVELE